MCKMLKVRSKKQKNTQKAYCQYFLLKCINITKQYSNTQQQLYKNIFFIKHFKACQEHTSS